MPFYFRKSKGFGPLRFTLSKSGLSTSVGVRGFRITSGARGTNLTIGRGGFYYRQRLDSSDKDSLASTQARENITSAQLQELGDSSPDSLLNQLNECARKHLSAAAILSYVLCLLFAAIAFVESQTNGLIAAISCSAMVGCLILARRIGSAYKRRNTVDLAYELDEAGTLRAKTVKAAITALSACDGLWEMKSREVTSDWKRHGGATSLVERRKIIVVLNATAPHIRTNIEVSEVRLSEMTLYFFPDRILVWQSRQYGSVSYENLTTAIADSQFHEEQDVPRDAEVVGHAWKYVNKNGGPDRRFANNHQIPIVQYGTVLMRCGPGLQVAIMTSRLSAAQEFIANVCILGTHRG